MDFSLLQEFVCFANCMNVSEVARRLHISQPTVSHHIMMLEKELGVKLTNHEYPLELTVAGRAFVGYASQMLTLYDSMISAVQNKESETLTLTIAYEKTDTAPHRTLYARLYNFAEGNNNFYVQTANCNASTALHILVDENVDCVGVYLAPLQSDVDAGVVFRKIPALFPNQLCAWLDKSNPLSQAASVSWADLAALNHPVPEGYFHLWRATTQQMLESHCPGLKMTSSALNIEAFLLSLKSNDFQLYDASSMLSMTLSMDSRHMAVPIAEPDAFAECFIAYLPDRIRPALQAFLDYLDTLE